MEPLKRQLVVEATKKTNHFQSAETQTTRGSSFWSRSDIGDGSRTWIFRNEWSHDFNLFESCFWSSTNKWKWTISGIRRVHDNIIDKLFVFGREIRVDQKQDSMNIRHVTTSSNFWTWPKIGRPRTVYENNIGTLTVHFLWTTKFSFIALFQFKRKLRDRVKILPKFQIVDSSHHMSILQDQKNRLVKNLGFRTF